MLYRNAVRRYRRASLSFAITLAIPAIAMLSPLTARAGTPESPPAPELGRPGQVVLAELAGIRTGVPLPFYSLTNGAFVSILSDVGWGGALGYNRAHNEYITRENGTLINSDVTAESLWIAPAADVFVRPRFSIGLSAGVLWARQRAKDTQQLMAVSEAYSIAVAPRVGYLIPVGGGFSFWPRLSVSFSYSEQAVTALPDTFGTGSIRRSIGAGLDLGIVYHPTEHLVFKLAPQIAVDRSMSMGSSSASLWMGEGTSVRVGGEATLGVVL